MNHEELSKSWSPSEQAEWLKKRINDSLEYLEGQKEKNKRWASYLKLLVIILSGTATILLGLQISNVSGIFKDIAFVMISFVTLINAIEPFFNYRSLWIEQEIAQANLHRLHDKLEFYLKGSQIEQLTINAVFNEFIEIWDTHNHAWAGYRKQGIQNFTYS